MPPHTPTSGENERPGTGALVWSSRTPQWTPGAWSAAQPHMAQLPLCHQSNPPAAAGCPQAMCLAFHDAATQATDSREPRVSLI